MGQSWAQQRTEAARLQAERLRERQDAEHVRAEAMLAAFVAAARDAGLAPEPLVVRGYGGRGTARTPLRGWYLRTDRTAAVSDDGAFYVLTAPLTVLDRLRGVRPEPKRPPLVLGAGGKDGDSIELAVALDRLLPGRPSGPAD
ncbi:hypothetical protein [Myceligenerans pegani]|uniref:Uncharacterized protein n=1 Tax=Myceligenerans pegani TaxID=2776917 RepID=A0ABR9N1Q2_9MICO|nr:hypothetical protein [Myceligenerans sp. TRM 65318]MBE1877588.1 hypothetical protein [Myceligenerans sp. TRM 65318]MBE3019859.1 hypothetical protein [Myceligenerans sp. TRM 65318]